MQTVSQESNTTNYAGPARRSAPIDPQVADRLLDLPSTDDAFRKLFAREPAKALAQVGFVKAAGEFSPEDCFWGIRQLASKAQIPGARRNPADADPRACADIAWAGCRNRGKAHAQVTGPTHFGAQADGPKRRRPLRSMTFQLAENVVPVTCEG